MTSPSFNYDAWKTSERESDREHNPMCGCPACDPDAARELLQEDPSRLDWEPE